MNWYFYSYFLPFVGLLVCTAFAWIEGIIEVYWSWVLGSWILIGPIGIGVGFHRLFSHRQFLTWRPVEIVLALLGTMSGYAPLLFWVANHQYHHKFSDTDQDPSSPQTKGFWESFLWYRLRESALDKIDLANHCTKAVLRDQFLRHISRRFLIYAWLPIVVTLVVSPSWAASLFIIPIAVEHFRTNAVSSLSHMRTWFSYQNFDSGDNSHNDLLIGFLTFGFGWHNNHHHNPRQCNLRVRFWEVDLEYLICKLLAKKIETVEGKSGQSNTSIHGRSSDL